MCINYFRVLIQQQLVYSYLYSSKKIHLAGTLMYETLNTCLKTAACIHYIYETEKARIL